MEQLCQSVSRHKEKISIRIISNLKGPLSLAHTIVKCYIWYLQKEATCPPAQVPYSRYCKLTLKYFAKFISCIITMPRSTYQFKKLVTFSIRYGWEGVCFIPNLGLSCTVSNQVLNIRYNFFFQAHS